MAYVIACSKKDSPAPVIPPPTGGDTSKPVLDSPYVVTDFTPHIADNNPTLKFIGKKKVSAVNNTDQWRVRLVKENSTDTLSYSCRFNGDTLTSIITIANRQPVRYKVILTVASTVSYTKVFDSLLTIKPPVVSLNPLPDTLQIGKFFRVTGKGIGSNGDSVSAVAINQTTMVEERIASISRGPDSDSLALFGSTPAGKYKIRYTSWGQTVESNTVYFKPVPPSITASGCGSFAGTDLYISCYNGSAGKDSVSVFMDPGDGSLQPIAIGSIAKYESGMVAIIVRVPENMQPGDHKLVVKTTGMPDAATQFHVLTGPAPVITALNKTSFNMAQDEVLEITGVNLDASKIDAKCDITESVYVTGQTGLLFKTKNFTFNEKGHLVLTIPANSIKAADKYCTIVVSFNYNNDTYNFTNIPSSLVSFQ
ncbi:hypothetical protein DXN05_11690 [Deminuibacter soli]|uniref:IPT/TIG domain-containing protein n=2 Tax=Deminuibacter soli TaxID=2291815 RepID=A0A3E1NJR5_9BACT|nr:hypothetical protein DXN05_11690 [Deminuibacter soli]